MKPYRKEKVASLIRSIIGEALISRLHDPRIATLTTVTRVEMTGDLQIAKIYLSIPGGDVEERRTMAGIKHASGFLQRLVAEQVTLRHCPALQFAIDEAGKTALMTLRLIEENSRKRARDEATSGPLDDEAGDDHGTPGENAPDGEERDDGGDGGLS